MTSHRAGEDRPAVVVLADDLIWASRLLESVRRAGALAVRLGSQSELDIALEAMDLVEPGPAPDPAPTVAARVMGAVVDLNGRRYDGVRAIERIHAARLPVIAVAEHDDQVTRRRALEAGAARVFSYNKFFSAGPQLVTAWLAAQGAVGPP